MQIKSIRAYLAAILVSTLCIVNFVAALNGYINSTRLADQRLDQRLNAIATSIAKLDEDLPYKRVVGDGAIFQVWVSGLLTSASQNAPKEKLTDLKQGLHVVNLKGVQWRLNTVQHSNRKWVIYGERYDSYRKLIDELVAGSILPIIWVLPIIALLVWWIVGYGLQPLQKLSESLVRRDENDLKRMSLDNYPSELSQVVESVNELFERLEQALERERRFSANAAHELRTPVAVLKVSLHNHIKKLEKTAQEIPKAGSDDLMQLKDSVVRMEQSIEQILALHQLTPENVNRTLGECELLGLTQEVILSVYSNIQTKSIDVELIGEPLTIQADPNALSVMIKNLLENAIKYTPEFGKISLTAITDNNGGAVFVIEDSGPGIPESDYSKVFDRFYRVSSDRSDSRTTGSGLGLSIVKHVLDLHRGDITLSKSSELGGLYIQATLPSLKAAVNGENNE